MNMDHLISQYIDDELTLDDKIEFVRVVHREAAFKEETVALLAQEKLLRETLATKAPEVPGTAVVGQARRSRFVVGPVSWSGWAVAVLLLFVFAGTFFREPGVVELAPSVAVSATQPHRFVIYKPGITSAEISGSFTGWRKVPLRPAATEGYWEVTLELGAGEHRYVFILDDSTLFPDPAVPSQETDDFGANNSILLVEA